MTVTGTAGALGVCCGLADLTSEQPAPQSSQSDKAAANGHHERLMRLSCFIAIVFLHSLWRVRSPWADATEPGPTGAEVFNDTISQVLPRGLPRPFPPDSGHQRRKSGMRDQVRTMAEPSIHRLPAKLS
jgi:hypothetical protein